jgi:hypothetical protein
MSSTNTDGVSDRINTRTTTEVTLRWTLAPDHAPFMAAQAGFFPQSGLPTLVASLRRRSLGGREVFHNADPLIRPVRQLRSREYKDRFREATESGH